MKKNILQFIFFGLFFMGLSLTADAQFRVGGGLAFNTEEGPGIGIDLRAEYVVNEKFVIAPNFNLFFKNDGVSVSEFNADIHYAVNVSDGLGFYPLGGINITRIKFDLGSLGSASNSEFGLNAGGGLNFGISDNLRVFGELKYVLLFDAGGYNPLVLSAGVMYQIGG